MFTHASRPKSPLDPTPKGPADTSPARSPVAGADYAAQRKALSPAGAGFVGDRSEDWSGPPTSLDDPSLRDTHTTDGSLSYRRFEGDLFIDGVAPQDVEQGAIADCYLMAAMAAIASTDPSIFTEGIERRGDGHYAVRFFEKASWQSQSFKEVWIDVDTELPASAGASKPAYGRGCQVPGKGRELWPALVEKAYATWKRGYNEMGEGGSSVDALEALGGKTARRTSTKATTEDKVWAKLKDRAESGKALTAGTHGKEDKELYEGINLYPWHAYTVLGVREDDGVRYVKLRNPWGKSEPGNDGKDDGIFELTVADFMKFYSAFNYQD